MCELRRTRSTVLSRLVPQHEALAVKLQAIVDRHGELRTPNGNAAGRAPSPAARFPGEHWSAVARKTAISQLQEDEKHCRCRPHLDLAFKQPSHLCRTRSNLRQDRGASHTLGRRRGWRRQTALRDHAASAYQSLPAARERMRGLLKHLVARGEAREVYALGHWRRPAGPEASCIHIAKPLAPEQDAGWLSRRAGRGSERRPPLASLAPHQPRPVRDAAYALERGGVARRPRRVQAGARGAERDPARGVVQLVRGDGERDGRGRRL